MSNKCVKLIKNRQKHSKVHNYKKNTGKTENPCVPGSIPGEATIIKNQQKCWFFCLVENKCEFKINNGKT